MSPPGYQYRFTCEAVQVLINDFLRCNDHVGPSDLHKFNTLSCRYVGGNSDASLLGTALERQAWHDKLNQLGEAIADLLEKDASLASKANEDGWTRFHGQCTPVKIEIVDDKTPYGWVTDDMAAQLKNLVQVHGGIGLVEYQKFSTSRITFSNAGRLSDEELRSLPADSSKSKTKDFKDLVIKSMGKKDYNAVFPVPCRVNVVDLAQPPVVQLPGEVINDGHEMEDYNKTSESSTAFLSMAMDLTRSFMKAVVAVRTVAMTRSGSSAFKTRSKALVKMCNDTQLTTLMSNLCAEMQEATADARWHQSS